MHSPKHILSVHMQLTRRDPQHHITHCACVPPTALSGVSRQLIKLAPSHLRPEKVVYENIRAVVYSLEEKRAINSDLKIPRDILP